MVTIALLAITGLAQMPIFKRYYIADLPGLGWLADYYFTHYLHYIGAGVFGLLVAYRITVSMLLKQEIFFFRFWPALIYGGIVFTGVLRMFKNFSGMYFQPNAVAFMDFGHLLFVSALAVFAVVKRLLERL
jgi:hypothetical protein